MIIALYCIDKHSIAWNWEKTTFENTKIAINIAGNEEKFYDVFSYQHSHKPVHPLATSDEKKNKEKSNEKNPADYNVQF